MEEGSLVRAEGGAVVEIVLAVPTWCVKIYTYTCIDTHTHKYIHTYIHSMYIIMVCVQCAWLVCVCMIALFVYTRLIRRTIKVHKLCVFYAGVREIERRQRLDHEPEVSKNIIRHICQPPLVVARLKAPGMRCGLRDETSIVRGVPPHSGNCGTERLSEWRALPASRKQALLLLRFRRRLRSQYKTP